MDYYVRSQLPILTLEEECEALDRNTIRTLLIEKPFNLILVEVKGKLFGIVSQGDLIRADERGEELVRINRSFTALQGKQFMRAREIFREKENFREIPVTDAEGKLIGVCTRSDDLLYLEYSDAFESNRYVRPFLDKLKAARFVRAPKGDTRRQRVIDRWISEFEKSGVVCEQIGFDEITEKQKDNIPILLADEEINLGAHAVLDVLDKTPYRFGVVRTLKTFENEMSEHAYDELIGKLAGAGIKIYNMYFTEDENTEERKRLFDGFRDWLKRPEARDVNPYVIPSSAPGFYGELYTKEYAEEVGKHNFLLESNDIYTRLKDTSGPYFNVVDGDRVTLEQPEDAERTIWFFGPCFMIGAFVEDKYTIETILQQRLNREGYRFKVVNCGCFESHYQEMVHITSTPMRAGDILVMHVENRPFEGTESIDLTELLVQNKVPNDWLLDLPLHCNHKVNKIYADDLFDRMVRDGVLNDDGDGSEKRTMLSRALAVNSLYLDLHFNDFHPKEGERIGTVGMHGNPFTLGHRYLIETASKQVDKLFVLLIEDELGIFSYAERFAMAVEGTRDLPNVRIVSGGPFQATRNVFREYFVKVQPTDMRESATADALIYTEIIGPRLGISCRFFGDERHNPKMQFFNDLMLDLLPKYGIDAIEIPRAKTHGQSISASAARKAAAEGDRETLLQHIPETTVKYFIGEDEESTEE